MTTEQKKQNLLSLIGVESAQEMVGRVLVHLTLKDGVEVCELVQEILYIPKTACNGKKECLEVQTLHMEIGVIREEPNQDMADFSLFLWEGLVAEKDIVSFTIGNMAFSASVPNVE
jgi:hypothetical protein